MNVDDLEWQRVHLGGVSPRIVDEILEHGGLEPLVEAARERGDWFCAEGAVRGLCAEGEFARAWDVIEPFAATGWQPAVRLGADVLAGWGRIDRALELADPEARDEETRDTWPDYAEVLVKAGLVDEAIDVLVPHLCNAWVLRSLVRMTEGQGRDDRVLELLAPMAEEFRRGQEQCKCGGHGLWDVLPAQALVLERSGRVDEAIGLLGADVAARRYGPRNTVEFYTELLARHGRIEELHELASGTQMSVAARPYVTALEALGRAGDAEAYLRRLIDAGEYPTRYRSELLELLVRQGRFEEAIEAVAHTFDDVHENLLQPAMLLLAEHGNPARALELTEGRSAEFLEESGHWLPSNRWWLMGEVGRCREAIAEIEALPPDEVDDRDVTIALLLAKDGCEEEAIAHLRKQVPGRWSATDLARLLVQQGRCAEAIAAIPDVTAQRDEQRRAWGK
ncbi:tetratricopeptide repeat protein [Streptomyces sp. NPDC059718]